MNIALFKNRSLGDALMTLSSIQHVKSTVPGVMIHVFFPAWIVPLFKTYHDRQVFFHTLDVKSLKGLFKLKKDLNALGPNFIYQFHSGGRLSQILNVYSKLKSIPYYFHSHHHSHSTGIPDQGKPIPAIQRDLNGVHFALKELNLTREDYPHFLNGPPVFPLAKKSVKEKKIILGLVASRVTKMVPAQKLRPLLKILMDKYSNYQWICPITANDQWIKNDYQDLPIKWVEWKLEDLPMEFSQAELYIGNDTGLKHLAIGLGLKSFTFFGPELPSEWHPYDEKIHPFYFKENLSCRVVKAHYCGLTSCDSMICLNSFDPQQVSQTITQLLEN